ncbi:hypothetical protein [Solimicrobium silvestre]|uniref:DUF4440 domain-containing protein n=1 Tax=Solimicrobium silvestre TaxID=2099400 RepID=A0A2S9GZL3_9BURK|nr:hypothetical protein [Solimicrobium silvestre]PRC93175.1 hypothetical protein S2091_2261 [Solimicrobium silvestre]
MKFLVSVLACVLFQSGSANAATPSYLENHATSSEDFSSITKLIGDFGTAIKTKNPKLLSTLVLNNKVLFMSPWPVEDIKEAQNGWDTTFDGTYPDGYSTFVKLLKTEKSPIEEKFYNVKITQDDNLAWVMSDFEFMKEGVTLNHGVKVWQLMKSVDGNWKILSVVWSSKGKPSQ